MSLLYIRILYVIKCFNQAHLMLYTVYAVADRRCCCYFVLADQYEATAAYDRSHFDCIDLTMLIRVLNSPYMAFQLCCAFICSLYVSSAAPTFRFPYGLNSVPKIVCF